MVNFDKNGCFHRFVWAVAFFLGVAAIATIVPDIWFISAVAQESNVGKDYDSVLRTRSAAPSFVQSNDRQQDQEIQRLGYIAVTNRERLDEINSRIYETNQRIERLDLKNQELERQLIRIQGQVNTIFDLGRWVFGAAIAQLIQMAIGAAFWVRGKRQVHQ